MKISKARHAGFCFGVKRALEVAEQATQGKNLPIYTLGPLIHNQQVVDRLTGQGVQVAKQVVDVANGTLIIRSHGVAEKTLLEAENRGLEVINATCPFVKKAQMHARELYENGYQVVVVGDKKHPEVVGIVGWTNDQALVVESPEEARTLPNYEKIGVVAQTTQIYSNFAQVVEILKDKCQEIKVHNTICNATGERQKATSDLAQEVDVMIVVGGTNSANTQKLARLCRVTGTPTYLIETAQDLQEEWFDGVQHVGITAGASTPDWIIEEVKTKMTEMNGLNDEMDQMAMEEALNKMGDMADAFEIKEARKGDLVVGTVVQINDDEVLVDIRSKSEGVIPMRELSFGSVDPSDAVKVGDKIEVVILRVEDNEGKIICSKQRADAQKAILGLEKAFEEGTVVTGKVTEVVKGGLLVDLGLRAFMPASLVDRGFVENLQSFVGQTISAKIVEYNKEKGRVVLSRKVVLEAEAAKQKEQTMQDLSEGQVRKGVVRRLTNFGAFVDLGGVDGLLHISEMAWYRVKDPSEIVNVGDEVEVMVLGVEKNGERISLGLKQVTASPWKNIMEKYPVGAVVEGKVVRLAAFGAFVELEPGVDGLVHLSQLADRRIANASEVVSVGEKVKVKVIDVKPEEHRISLSVREAADKPVVEQAAQDQAPEIQLEEAPKVTIGDMIDASVRAEIKDEIND